MTIKTTSFKEIRIDCTESEVPSAMAILDKDGYQFGGRGTIKRWWISEDEPFTWFVRGVKEI